MELIDIIIRQYLVLHTGALIRYSFYKFIGKPIKWDIITARNDDSPYPRNVGYNYYIGVIFWLVVVLVIVLF